MRLDGSDHSEVIPEVDIVVTLATDPQTAFVYWELPAARLAPMRLADPEGRLILRVVSFAPSGVETKKVMRDIPIDELIGDRFIRGLEPGCELRLCLGWLGRRGLVPITVGPDFRMPFNITSSHEGELATSKLAHEALRAAAREVCANGTDDPRYRDYLERVRQGDEPRKALIATIPPPAASS